MKIVGFYSKVFKIAFSHSLEKADLIGGVLAILGGAFVYFNPKFTQMVGLGLWLIPLFAFSILFIARLVLAPYWIFREEQNSRQKAENKLLEIEISQPTILFMVARQAQMYRPSTVIDGKVPIYELIQAWFRNSPKVSAERSIAKKMGAIIEFRDPKNNCTLFRVVGQWAQSTAPDHVGFSGITPTIDLPPGVLPAKLIIALKYRSEANAYAYSEESLRDHIDGRNPSLCLAPGEYIIHIQLTGLGIDNEYKFLLKNPGNDKSMELIST